MADCSKKLSAALRYARRGWRVIPIYGFRDGQCACGAMHCDNAGKHPRTPHGVKDATTDERRIREWWTEWPNANIAIATGPASGLLVVDVDPRNGGEESLKKLFCGSPLPSTPTVNTGGGGMHLYFKLRANIPLRTVFQSYLVSILGPRVEQWSRRRLYIKAGSTTDGTRN
jgi:hypothetical protein